jgi:hypothetical protein
VEFEFVVETNLVQMEPTNSSPNSFVWLQNERNLQSRPYSYQKLGRRDQSSVSAEFFPSFTRRSFPTGSHDAGRREPCEPQPCSLGERNVCRDLAAVGIPRHFQESLVRGSNEGALGWFSAEVDQQLKGFGLRVLRTPVRAPKANAYCRSWMRKR